MVRKAIALTLLIGSCFTSVVFAADPNCRDTYIVPGRAAMFEGSLSGLREAYTLFNAGVQDTNKCTGDKRKLTFLHAVTGTAMLFIDNNDVALQNSFLEVAGVFGVTVMGDLLDVIDVNVALDQNGCYRVPAGAPKLSDIPGYTADIINNSIVPEIERIVADLNSITDSPSDRFRMFLEPNETGLENQVEVDYGDVLVLKGLLLAFKGLLQAQSAYDIYINPDWNSLEKLLYEDGICPNTEITDVEFLDFLNIPVTDPKKISVNTHILNKYPNLLKILPTSGHNENGTAILAKARQDLVKGISYFLDAVDYIKSDYDPNENHLLYIDPNDTSLLDGVNEKLTTLRDSLKNDTVGTYQVETTKTYNVYDSTPTLIGQLTFSYVFPGLESEGQLIFTGGSIPSSWNVKISWDGPYTIMGDAKCYEGGQWQGGYFEATLSQDGNSLSNGTFEYWGAGVAPCTATFYEVWAGNYDYCALPGDYLYNIDKQDYVKLGESDGETKTFDGDYTFYVIAARNEFLLDAIQGSTGDYFNGYGTLCTGNVSSDGQGILGPPDGQYATVGLGATLGTFRGYVQVTNPGDWNSITVISDRNCYDQLSLSGLTGQIVSTDVSNVNVDLNPIFGGSTRYPNPVSPRNLLPQFDSKNEIVPGTLGHGLGNDATLGGILPDMTQHDWIDLFGLAAPDLTGEFGGIILSIPIVPGDKGKAPVVVTNEGEAIAKGKISIEVYASLDKALDGNDVLIGKLVNQSLSLAPAVSKSFTVNLAIPGNLSEGEYYLLAKVDSANAIAESNEENNLAVSDSSYEVVWKFGSFGGRKNVKLIVNDSNETPVTFSLTSGGYGVVNGNSDFNEVILNDTTDKSQLTIITTGKGKETSVGDIIVHGSVKDILAKTTDLRGDVVIDGSCRMLVFDDIAGEHTITIGSSSDPKAGATIICDQVSDCGIESGIPITRLTATEWLNTAGSAVEQIQATRIDTLQIKGDKKRGLAGDFQGSLQLSGSTDPKKSTLGNGKIAGTMSNDSEINGSVGTLNIKALHGGLHISGNAKNIIIGEPMSLPVEGVTALGVLSIDGTGTVKSAKETIKGQDIDLCTRDTVGIYRLEDLRRYDILWAWWDYEGDYSVKVTGEPKEVNTVDFTTTVSEIVDINGHDCFKVTTSALDTDVSMAWYTDSNGTYLAEYINNSGLFDMDLEMSSTLVAPQYLELGKTYKGSGTINSGEFTVYDTPYGDLVGTVNGTIKTTCKLVKHEQVLVGSDTYLAARIDFGMTMQGQIAITSPPVTATYKATLTQTYWAVPDIGIVKANTTKYEVKVSIPGAGSTTSTGNEVDELTDYGP
jgi:hypothetical protein